ncbi:MAG: tetratricopeptide repeat protein [Pseudomonadota bacterium]
MSERPLLAEHSAAFCVAVAGLASGGVGMAAAGASAAVLTAIGLDKWNSCDAATMRAATRAANRALEQHPDIPDHCIAAAAHLLKTHQGRITFDPERMTEAVKTGSATDEIMASVFGDLRGEDPGTVTALRLTVEAAFDAFRGHSKYRDAFTQEMVKVLVEDHAVEVKWREQVTVQLVAQNSKLDEILLRLGGGGAALAAPEALSLDELQTLAAGFGDTPGWGKAELIQFLDLKAQEYASFQAQIDLIDERTAGLGNLKAAAKDAAERLDFEEVETLLARVDEVETEIAAQTKELRADNALLRGRVEEAYRLLSAAADSFGSVDALEPARKRLWKYTEKLLSHGQRYGGRGIDLSITMTRTALPEFKEEEHPREFWAAQVFLANALGNQGSRTGGEESAALLAEAVAAYRAALRVRTEADHPVDWAMTQNNLGNALGDQGSRMGGEAGAATLAEAVAAYRAALRVYTEADHPVYWAGVQNNLGTALRDQGSRTGGEAGAALLGEAVAVYRAALGVRTKVDRPVDWAMTQNNLGVALWNQGRRKGGADGAALQAEAVTAYREALRVRTEADHPVDWAMTQNNLAIALSDQGSRTGGEAGATLLSEAVAAYHAALRVRTEADHPVDWAMTQNNLALALNEQLKLEDTANARFLWTEAVAACDAALRVNTRESHPVEWAMRHESAAISHEAFGDHAGREERREVYGLALEAICNSLEVYDPEHMAARFKYASALKSRVEAKLAGLEGCSD